MEVPEAIDRLLNIFGKDSVKVVSTLVDDLTPDPEGTTRAAWDEAIARAKQGLEKLKRDRVQRAQKPTGNAGTLPFVPGSL